MTDKEAVFLRASRRTYLDYPIPAEQTEKLLSRIDALNVESGLSIRLVLDGAAAFDGLTKSYGLFRGVRSFFAMAGEKNDPNLYEKVGYYGEQLVLYATQLGLGTCWVGGTFSRRGARVELNPDETLVLVITVGVAPDEPDKREAVIRRFTHRKAKKEDELYEAEGSVPEWFLFGIRAVQRAPSAMNRQPVKFCYAAGTVTTNGDTLKGMQRVDLGIAKLHFEIGAERPLA